MSWSISTLGDLCSFENGDRGVNYPGKSALVDSGVPFVNAGDLKDNLLRNNGLSFISEQQFDKLSNGKFSKGDFLFCLRGTLGKFGLVESDIRGAIASSLVIIRPNQKLDSRYLNAYFASDFCAAQIELYANGAAQPNLAASSLKQFQIPLPPLEEQKRIAAILDQADALRRKRQRALDCLNQLGQAIFVEMFGDLVQNDKTWPKGGVLGDHTEIASGITKGRDPKGRATRVVPYLAVVNVQDKKLQLEAPKEIEATEDEISRFKLVPGDLLLTEGGDPDKLGRGTLWNAELPECIHQNHVFRVRLSSIHYNSTFLNWIVGSAYGKKYFLRAAKQTTGIASINMSQLKAFPLLMPPIELQDDFKRKLDQLRSETEKLAFAARSSDDLFTSLQHRAFRGELTSSSLKEAAA
jgi:type I restriction enzyme, S subunit